MILTLSSQVLKPDSGASGKPDQPAGKSLRLKHEPDGTPMLDPIEFTILYGHGMTVKMYSSWDALAVILNCELPPYDPTVGPAKGYAFSILTLLARWSMLMGDCLTPNKHFPPVFCVSYTEIQSDSTPDTSQKKMIFLLSTGKALDLAFGDERTRVTKMLLDARRDQALPRNLFDAEDNPLASQVLLKGLLPQTLDDLRAQVKNYSACSPKSPKPITGRTVDEFCNKWPSDLGYNKCNNLIGSCAETWGFQFMLQLLGSGGRYYSIALGQDKKKLNRIKLSPGYKYSSEPKITTKGICNTCFYVACAIKAKRNITMDEIKDITDIFLDVADSNPVPTTLQDDGSARDQEVLPNLPRERESDTTEPKTYGISSRRGGFLGRYFSSI